MMRAFTSALAGCVLFLAGCTGGDETSGSQAAQAKAALQSLLASRGEQPALPLELTPQLIASLTVPSLEIFIENSGAVAYLVPFSDRRDGGPGALRTWRTADDSQVTLRQGVVVTTRGIGNDLNSSDANAAVKAIRTRSPISGPHTLYLNNGENGISRIDLLCEMRSVGAETIEIVERKFNVLHLQENCTGTKGIITYDYWIDRNDATVRQSRQWIGPEVGYVRTRLLKK
ncbi:YjbF family lipoprotein [Tateyamaria sp.]|uniref:YjbF family lipoprotein n=1 Tax=Tateyamaria sp. TaxID=1929288 RepID=UPI00329A87B3